MEADKDALERAEEREISDAYEGLMEFISVPSGKDLSIIRPIAIANIVENNAL